MTETLLDVDPLTGAKEWFAYDELTDTFTIRREEDQTAILARNAELRKASGDWKGEMHHVGSIPMSVYHEQLVKTGRIKSQRELKRWWNNSDQEVFRVKRGWV